MKLLGTPGQHLITYVAEPATPEHDKIVLLDMLAAQGKAETVTPSSSQAAQDGNQQ